MFSGIVPVVYIGLADAAATHASQRPSYHSGQTKELVAANKPGVVTKQFVEWGGRRS